MTKVIGNNIDYSGNCTAVTETKADIEAYAEERMLILDDFFGKKKPTKSEKTHLLKAMKSMNTKWGVDKCFHEFLDQHAY